MNIYMMITYLKMVCLRNNFQLKRNHIKIDMPFISYLMILFKCLITSLEKCITLESCGTIVILQLNQRLKAMIHQFLWEICCKMNQIGRASCRERVEIAITEIVWKRKR